jgi:hypothetical protein
VQRDSVGSTHFLLASAVIELGAGLALVAAPALAITLVFGASGTTPGLALGRLAGLALLSLGLTCWLARDDAASAATRALVTGMCGYNAAVVTLVLTGGMGPVGLLLWGIVVLHVGMALWGILLLRRAR